MNAENRYQPPKSPVADVSGRTVAIEEELGSRWARLGAAIIDGLILMVLAIAYLFLSGMFERLATLSDPSVAFAFGLQMTVFSVVAFLAVNGYLLHKYGQTVGKRAADLRIVAVDEARILPWWKVFLLRHCVQQMVSLIPSVGGIIAFVDILFIFRSDKRCIHDLITGTRVINADVPWKAYDAP